MEYEAFEPDCTDEFYDELCEVTYAVMFNEGREWYETNNSGN